MYLCNYRYVPNLGMHQQRPENLYCIFSPDAISAISHTLTEAQSDHPIISAASFPDDDPVQVNPDQFRTKPENLPKFETELILKNRYESDPTDAAFM